MKSGGVWVVWVSAGGERLCLRTFYFWWCLFVLHNREVAKVRCRVVVRVTLAAVGFVTC